MTKEETVTGIVTETLPNLTFRVEIDEGREVLAYLGGRMRKNRIKVAFGDKVDMVLSPDGERGRVVYRHLDKKPPAK